jgi:hypothetical protein
MMPGIRRRAAKVLTALSAFLCIAMGIFWARGYYVRDDFYWISPHGYRDYGAESTLGKISVSYSRLDSSHILDHATSGFHYASERPLDLIKLMGYPDYFRWGKMGFFVHIYELHWTSGLGNVCTGKDFMIGIPDWLLIGLFGVAPAIWIVRHMHQQFPPGHCQKCGYDLRATPDRCPECGSPVEVVSPIKSI